MTLLWRFRRKQLRHRVKWKRKVKKKHTYVMDDKWMCESEVSKISFALLLPVLLLTIIPLSFFLCVCVR